MTKNVLKSATICLAATLFISVNTSIIKAAEIQTDTAVAGITVSLDKYYAATLEKQMEDITQEVLLPLKASKTAVVTTNTIDVDNADNVQTNQQADLANETINVSPYTNLGISIADDYVNIRSKANEESEILGKLYQGSSASILETDGEWVKIQSGSVEGYIMSNYLAIGDEAEKVAGKYGTKQATITTTTLKVREEKNIESVVLTLIPEGETYDVIKEYDGWVKIQVDEDLKGFVSKTTGDEKLVDVTMSFTKAVSIEEEQAKIEAEKRAEQEAIEEQNATVESSKAQSSNVSTSSSNSTNSNTTSRTTSSNTTSNQSSSSNNSVSSSQSSSSNNSDIVSYAMQFLGNRYVYGGTSLTNGTDCSGFTMQIYSHFGYSIPRTSRDQANAGRSVSFDSLQKGDLIFYAGSNGVVGHVAMYIGGGQVIHASTEKTGIRISNMYYRTPYTARRIMN